MKTNNNRHFPELKAYGIDSGFLNQAYDAEEISQLFSAAKKVHCEPQQSIYQEGMAADTIYFIKKGMVKLISYLPNGKARIVRLLGPGKILGLDGVVASTYEHTAVAIHSLELLKIPSQAVRRFKIQDPAKFLLFGEQWYDYLRAADTWITQFSTGSITAVTDPIL